MDYLTNATNAVFEVSMARIDPSLDDFERIFTIACKTFAQLSQDDDFFSAVRELDSRRELNAHLFMQITQLDHFIGPFRRIEKDLLLAAGLKHQAADLLLQAATGLLPEIQGPPPTLEEIRRHVENARVEACVNARLLQERRQTEEQRQKNKKRLLRFGYALGGGALIFTNVSALAASIGLSVAGSAVSGAAGVMLINNAVKIS